MVKRDIILQNPEHDKPILIDARFIPSQKPQPVVVFIHGFKGFKDWGHWNLIADQFAEKGYCFIKINLSHNGTTPQNPVEFDDLEAFSNNTLTLELNDVGVVIDYLHAPNDDLPDLDLEQLFLIGHSRGGGTALLKACEDERIRGVITWASVSDYEKRWPQETLDQWKKNGVFYIHNGRTHQDMPMKYVIVEDYYQNQSRLDIQKAVSQLDKPLLIIHGTEDPTVELSEAKNLHNWVSNSELLIIKGADHVFNGKHPFEEKELPPQSQKLVDKTLSFLEKVTVS